MTDFLLMQPQTMCRSFIKGFVTACAAHLYWAPLETAAATGIVRLLLQHPWRCYALRRLPHTTRMRLKRRMVMTAQPTVISRRPTQAPSGLPDVPSVPWVSAAAACLKGLPLHRQDAPPQRRLWVIKSSRHTNRITSIAVHRLRM